jgi:hypothetical protein
VIKAGSRDIYAEGVITGCLNDPDACKLQVDLEQYNGDTGLWNVVAHKAGTWGSCKQGTRVQAKYTCTHHPSVQYGYRSSIYFVAEKGGTIGNVGHAYSKDYALFWCV